MAKRKVGRKIKKSLKKMSKSSLLKSSAVLYLALIVAIGLVLLYLSKKDYNSLIVMVAVGLLTNYFTKNMTITLGVAILVSLIVRMQISRKEGFKEGTEDGEDESGGDSSSGDSSSGGDSSSSDSSSDSGGDDSNNSSNSVGKAAINDAKNHKCFKKKGDKWEKTDYEKDACDDTVDDTLCWNTAAEKCKAGFSKRLIPSSEPARVDGGDDEVDTERIDYAKTLEQAYDNLQGMLGKDGIKGLTSETSKLVQQQQGLMESLKGMGPMLKEAKSMMAGMKDFGGMGSMKDINSMMKGLNKN